MYLYCTRPLDLQCPNVYYVMHVDCRLIRYYTRTKDEWQRYYWYPISTLRSSLRMIGIQFVFASLHSLFVSLFCTFCNVCCSFQFWSNNIFGHSMRLPDYWQRHCYGRNLFIIFHKSLKKTKWKKNKWQMKNRVTEMQRINSTVSDPKDTSHKQWNHCTIFEISFRAQFYFDLMVAQSFNGV